MGDIEALAFATFPLLLGAVQSLWARQASRRYRRYRELAQQAPAAEAVSALEAMADQLAGAKRAEDAETVVTVEITTIGRADTGRWRARLAERWALFVDRAGSALTVSTPDELEVSDRGERLVSHAHKATVRLGDRRIRGTMSAASLARLQAWKQHHAPGGLGTAP